MRIVCNSCTVNCNSNDGRKVGLRGRAPLEGRMWHGAGCAVTGEVRVWWRSRTPGPSECLPWSGTPHAPCRTAARRISLLPSSFFSFGLLFSMALVVLVHANACKSAFLWNLTLRPRGVSKYYDACARFPVSACVVQCKCMPRVACLL